MTPIGVYRDNARVWIPGYEVRLTQEAEDWLERVVGTRQFRHPDQPEYQPPRDHWIIMNSGHNLLKELPTKIYFSNKAHAALFKLTFL